MVPIQCSRVRTEEYPRNRGARTDQREEFSPATLCFYPKASRPNRGVRSDTFHTLCVSSIPFGIQRDRVASRIAKVVSTKNREYGNHRNGRTDVVHPETLRTRPQRI